MMIIVRGSISFAFLCDPCPFWTWIAILGSSQWSKVTLNNCSFIWTLSEIFDSFLEIEAFMRSFAVSSLLVLFWSQLGLLFVLSLAFGPSCAIVRKRRVNSFQILHIHFLSFCQCVHQGGDCGYHGDMLIIIEWCYNWQWRWRFVETRVFGKV